MTDASVLFRSTLRDVDPDINEAYLSLDHSRPERNRVALSVQAMFSGLTKALPDKRAVDHILTDDATTPSFFYRDVFTDEQRTLVLNSRLYSQLLPETGLNGSHKNLSVQTIVKLMEWGGEELFDTFDTNIESGILKYTISKQKLYSLLSSSWRTDEPVDLAEVLFVLSPYWLHRLEAYTLQNHTMLDWARVIADPSLRAVLSRRNDYDLHRLKDTPAIATAANLIRMKNTSGDSSLAWFVLAQARYSSFDKTEIEAKDESINRYRSGIISLMQSGHSVHEIAPYIASGVSPHLVLDVIDHDIDLDLARAMSD
jgi:hypothetical protein